MNIFEIIDHVASHSMTSRDQPAHFIYIHRQPWISLSVTPLRSLPASAAYPLNDCIVRRPLVCRCFDRWPGSWEDCLVLRVVPVHNLLYANRSHTRSRCWDGAKKRERERDLEERVLYKVLVTEFLAVFSTFD